MIRSLALMVVIEYSMSFCFSKAARISGTVAAVPAAFPSAAILLTARFTVKYSFTAGSTRMPISAAKPRTTAQNIRPNRVTPRWRLALSTCPIIRPPSSLAPAPPLS